MGYSNADVKHVAISARRKLVIACLFSLFFMFAEIVGGFLAGSLAIMTDAAHLLSDVAGFLISLFAIWIGGFPASSRMSYGFQRAEVIGAVVSVLVIWVLTGCLVYAATQRLIEDLQPFAEERVNGKIMFITACLGLLVNLCLMSILGHGHSHGIAGGHGHSHGIGGRISHSQGSGSNTDNSSGRHQENLDRIDETYYSTSQGEYPASPRAGGSDSRSISGRGSNTNGNPKTPGSQDCEMQYTRQSSEKKTENDEGNDVLQSGNSSNPVIQYQRRSSAGGHLEQGHRHSVSPMARTSHSSHGKSGSKSISEKKISNINIQAAYIHALGDFVQSIGVCIAGAIVWINPKWQIADPIATYIFSILVLFTTIDIIKHSVHVLMEGTPEGVDPVDIEEGFRRIPGVLTSHDLHIWSLTVGMPSLSVHLIAHDPENVLEAAQDFLLTKGITHATIQIEHAKKTYPRDCSILRCNRTVSYA